MAAAPDHRSHDILQAALGLFRKRGFHGASLDDIAHAAGGLTGPAVYRHFADKEHLLAACHQVLLERLMGEEHRADAVEALVRACIREPEAMAVYYTERINLGPAGSAAIRDLERRAAAVMQRAFGNTMRDPATRIRAHAAAAVLTRLGLVNGPRSHGARERMARSLVEAIRTVDLPPAQKVVVLSGPPLQHVSARERILAAAPSLFRAAGSSGVSLRQIGAAAGISSAAVSSHFSSKEQLLHEVIQRGGEAIASSIARALRRTSQPAEALDQLVSGYVDLAVDSRDTFVVTSREMWALTPEHREVRRRQQGMYVAELGALLRSTHPRLDPVEARVRAGAVFACVNGAARAFPAPVPPDSGWVLAIAQAVVSSGD